MYRTLQTQDPDNTDIPQIVRGKESGAIGRVIDYPSEKSIILIVDTDILELQLRILNL